MYNFVSSTHALYIRCECICIYTLFLKSLLFVLHTLPSHTSHVIYLFSYVTDSRFHLTNFSSFIACPRHTCDAHTFRRKSTSPAPTSAMRVSTHRDQDSRSITTNSSIDSSGQNGHRNGSSSDQVSHLIFYLISLCLTETVASIYTLLYSFIYSHTVTYERAIRLNFESLFRWHREIHHTPTTCCRCTSRIAAAQSQAARQRWPYWRRSTRCSSERTEWRRVLWNIRQV